MHFASAFRLLCFALRGKHYRQPLLARERLRYVAEPIAAVFATDPYLAEGAAELVSIEADELPPILDVSTATGSFAPGQSTEALVLRAGYGDVEAAFVAAHAVVALDLTIGRHSGVPIETGRPCPLRHCRWRARIVRRGQGAPPQPRRAGAHVRPQHDGGGAGGRQHRRRVRRARRALPRRFSRLPRCNAIRAAGQMDRGPARAFDGRNHSREQRHHARAAVDADGQVLALEDIFYLDQGAYVPPRTPGLRR
jgi:aerobic carbon-monoxide dehydrogenase large subunit